MSKIFISYRRDDAADVTGRIYDRLKDRYQAENIFRDVDTIPLGVDFRTQLNEAVGRCAVLLVIIGRQWLTVTDAVGQRRLDDARDFVRIEIEAALQRNIPVIPVLVQRTGMPAESLLPLSLQGLAFRHAIDVRPDPDFHPDMDRLIQQLDRLVPPPEIVNSIGMKFVLAPPGSFWMGGSGASPGSQRVEISNPFYISVYLVTQGQWQAVMGNNPSYFSRTGGGKHKVKKIADTDLVQFPVESVSWNDGQDFLVKLNDREKSKEWVYRLPTDAEWEYICRVKRTTSGSQSLTPEEFSFDFYFDQPTNAFTPQLANFDNNLGCTSKVGSYRPNRMGIFDLHGNVWEWCDDLWEGGPHRVVRGGSWYDEAEVCTAAFRGNDKPDIRGNSLGFRLARVPSG